MMLERWYLTGDEECREDMVEDRGKMIFWDQFQSFEGTDPMSELILKLRFIMNDIVAVVDPPLHNHLICLQILPQIFGM